MPPARRARADRALPRPIIAARRAARAGLAMLVTAGLILAGVQAANAATTPNSGPAAGGTTTAVDVANLGMSFVRTYSGYSAQYAIGVTDNGTLYGWGDNRYGQLADGTTVSRSGPVQIGSSLASNSPFFSKTWIGIATQNQGVAALASDGTLWTWGNQALGRLANGVSTTTTTIQSAPAEVTYSGVGSVPTGVTFTQIAAGLNHTLALGSDNKIYSWGQNRYGEAGSLVPANTDGNTYSSTPQQSVDMTGVLAGTTIASLTGGENVSGALDSTGNAYMWGGGGSGALGNGATGDSSTPVAVTMPTGKAFSRLSGENGAMLALATDGTVYAWGNNGNGQLGNGTGSTSNVSTPAPVVGMSGKTIVQIAGGTSGSYAMAGDGTVYAWGSNSSGQLGFGTTGGNYSSATVTATGGTMASRTAAQISAGYSGHLTIVATDGTVHSVGQDAQGELGDGGTSTQTSPVALSAMPAVTVRFGSSAAFPATRVTASTVSVTVPAAAAAGVTSGAVDVVTTVGGNGPYASTSATISNGYSYSAPPTVTATVTPSDGPLAGGNTVSVTVPSQGMSFVRTYSGQRSAFVIGVTDNDQLYAWGKNSFGQLGDGTTTSSSTPVKVGAGTAVDSSFFTKRWAQIVTGSNWTMALATDGTLWGWGTQAYGQLGNGVTTSTTQNYPVQITPSAVSGSAVPAGVTYVQIAAGTDHMVALGSDGNMYSWGQNRWGELGANVPSNSNGSLTYAAPQAVYMTGVLAGRTIASVYAGDAFSGALDTTGKAYMWGAGGNGQLGNGTNGGSYSGSSGSPAPQVFAVTMPTGKAFSRLYLETGTTLGLTTDGSVYSWGANESGELGNGTTSTSYVTTPAPVVGLGSKTITQISGGQTTSYALASDGTVFGWGNNSNAGVGNGTTGTNYMSPVVTATGGTMASRTARQISAGAASHLTIVATDGTVQSVGQGTTGELGNGGTATLTNPVSLSDLPAVTVTFGSASPVTATLVNASTVSVVVPTAAAAGVGAGGAVNVVTSVGGNSVYPTTSNTITNGFTYNATPVVTTSTLTDPVVGTPYAATLAASGGNSPTFALGTGALPAGLTLNGTTGVISGTPTTAGAATFTIVATNVEGPSSPQSFTVTTRTAPAITTTTLPKPAVGAAYSATIATTGSGTPTFSVSAGAPPAGLTLDSGTGILAGTPTTGGTYSFTVRDSTGYGTPATQAFTVVIDSVPAITTTTLPDAVTGSSYSSTVAATGNATITFAVATGSLPTGLTLNTTTGAITGTPTVPGVANFVVAANNSFATTTRSLRIVVFAPPTIATASLASPVVSLAYSGSVVATGSGPITYSVGSGLPAGLSLDTTTGAITGTPTTAGSATFTVTATNVYGTATQSFTVVTRTVPAITSTSLTDATVGTAYSDTVVSTGSGPIVLAVSSGSLPAGLTLNTATGTISGTATVAGNSTFTVIATSPYGSTSQSFTIHAEPRRRSPAPRRPSRPPR